MLKKIAKNVQVINITHLPQVAAIAKYHLNVNKNDHGNGLENVNYLRKEDRIQVLAKMLGGDKTGKAALNNALELLNYRLSITSTSGFILIPCKFIIY